ncbi:glutamate/tyrosine decarboxylase-like PLP-dependent enzyme [Motilibacter peucedani]|uniref:Glutamate/tyrosine decarboxylase-like PLP-dependent enzyme n=1 Tax=Motilibacter peucedani TaxID=598650 RepID=A0A420XTQ5_9ACTN|nr:aminotransferase class V-fold PLP-dependent enzyme [Motilibacter peucedani]RKS80223.1 glutamate/tyrosine decarboxylase-like PLP-dependent enzyme [Motilibacter peucedani]
MGARGQDYDRALARADEHARHWLGSVGERPVPPRTDADAVLATLGGLLPESPQAADEVVDALAAAVEPGLMAIGSGRFFGWVMGGTLPAALAADWLVSTWDQNAGMRAATPGVVAAEEAAAGWLLDLLGLPSAAEVGFVSGATMANFTGLAAGRTAVLARAGHDVVADGLQGAPRVRVLVGAERHDTVDLALRYLGLGRPEPVPADDQGRVRTDALADALAALPPGSPVLVCLQAGNLHSGAFDPFAEAVEVAHRHGAWVHVDGAFGLWAAASPALAHLTAGMAGADSWASDAHKTLNAPYDCGIAVVADRAALRSTMGVHTSYLIAAGDDGPGDPHERVPELSRRARGVPVWAALRSLGRTGVASLVDGLAANARELAAGIATVEGAEVLNEVCYTQVCVSFGSDQRTRAVTARLLADGTAWMSGSRWRGRDVLRVSVSNWTTDADDVRRSVDAVRRAAS